MVNKLVNQPNSIARHATRPLLLLLTLLLTVAAAGSTGPIRVAVLPFLTPRNMPDLEQYGEGMMDSLIVGLHNVPQLILVDRGRIERILRHHRLRHCRRRVLEPHSAARCIRHSRPRAGAG